MERARAQVQMQVQVCGLTRGSPAYSPLALKPPEGRLASYPEPGTGGAAPWPLGWTQVPLPPCESLYVSSGTSATPSGTSILLGTGGSGPSALGV